MSSPIRLIALVLTLWLSGSTDLRAQGKGKPAPEEQTGLKVGEKAPKFTLKDREGKERSLDELLGKGVSAATARKILTSLKIAITVAQRRGLVAQNVAADVRYGKRKKRPLVEGEDLPTRAELQAILAAAGQWYPLLVTAAFSGMRASELRGLRWGDVDFDGQARTCPPQGGRAAQGRRSEIGRWNPHDPIDRLGCKRASRPSGREQVVRR